MRDKIKRVVCFLFVLLVLVVNLPATASALDPVSAATISNAFAQAITAYGASNGVSLTFDGIDSSNVSNIGENMHDLWAKFRAGQQTVDDWDTLAAAIFPGLYSRVVNAAGNAIVAVNIADTYMPDVDEFWNWLLSGPAEMQKVDDAFHWTISNGDIVTPKVLDNTEYSMGNIPVYRIPSAFQLSGYTGNDSAWYYTNCSVLSSSIGNQYCFISSGGSDVAVYILAPSIPSGTTVSISKTRPRDGTEYLNSGIFSVATLPNGWQYAIISQLLLSRTTPIDKSYLSTSIDVPANSDIAVENEDSITVRPYVGDSVAKPVPIPDTSDPDYGPLPYIGNLPIPWNDILFGDGAGTLTDAQSDAITAAIDDAIVANPDKTIEMEGATTDDPDIPTTDDPPSNDPDDYAVPGLQNIFPFCIPFDVYNFLSALAAEPTAPHFTATLQFPAAIGGPQTIDIDFNNQTFNTLAGILRTLELLAFIVGLALLTRSMFIRG